MVDNKIGPDGVGAANAAAEVTAETIRGTAQLGVGTALVAGAATVASHNIKNSKGRLEGNLKTAEENLVKVREKFGAAAATATPVKAVPGIAGNESVVLGAAERNIAKAENAFAKAAEKLSKPKSLGLKRAALVGITVGSVGALIGSFLGGAKGLKNVAEKNEAAAQQRAAAEQQLYTQAMATNTQALQYNAQQAFDQGQKAGAEMVIKQVQEHAQAAMDQQQQQLAAAQAPAAESPVLGAHTAAIQAEKAAKAGEQRGIT